MELRTFVSKALQDIVLGVADAQAATPSGAVVPSWPSTLQTAQAGLSDQPVLFEVTVRAEERAGSEAKLTVVAAIVGGGVTGESGNSSSYMAKLSFRVPVRFQAKAG